MKLLKIVIYFQYAVPLLFKHILINKGSKGAHHFQSEGIHDAATEKECAFGDWAGVRAITFCVWTFWPIGLACSTHSEDNDRVTPLHSLFIRQITSHAYCNLYMTRSISPSILLLPTYIVNFHVTHVQNVAFVTQESNL